MSGAPASGNYRALLSDRRTARMFALAFIGRFGYAVLPLSLLFAVAQSSGSFTLGATSSAAFGLAGLAMPIQSRLLDRHGQRRVLPAFGILFVAFLLAVAALAAAVTTSAAVWVLLCGAGGLVPPGLGPATRAQWREAVALERRPVAYSLDATAEEAVFFLGPIVSAGVLAAGPAWLGVAIAAVCIPIGVVGLVSSPYPPQPTAAREIEESTASAWLGPLQHGGFRVLLIVMLLTGVVDSAWLTLLAGIANNNSRPAIAGVVEAVAGITAVLGGAWWGRLRHHRSWAAELMTLSLARLPLVVLCALQSQLWIVAVVVTLTGFLSAPTFVTAFTASDVETPTWQHTEASTWVTTATNMGSSLGAAYAGLTVTTIGPAGAFAGLAVLALSPIALTATKRTRSRVPAA